MTQRDGRGNPEMGLMEVGVVVVLESNQTQTQLSLS